MVTLYKFTVFDSESFLKVRSFLSFGLQVRWTYLIFHFSFFILHSCKVSSFQLHWKNKNPHQFVQKVCLVLDVRLFCIIIINVVHCHFVTINFLSERLMAAFDRNEMVNLYLFHFFESFVVTTCVQPFIYLMHKALYRVKVFLLCCIFWVFCTMHFVYAQFRLLTVESSVQWR